MMVFRFIPNSPAFLLALLLAAGCGADVAPLADPLSKHAGDKLAADYQTAADKTEQAVADAATSKREADTLSHDHAALKEAAESLTKAGRSHSDWLPLMRAINDATKSLSGDSAKQVLVVEGLSAKYVDDLSKWFESLPEPAIAKLGEEDRRTPPAGAGWLWTLELRVDVSDDEHKETMRTEFAEKLRNSKLLDNLRLTHPVWKSSDEKLVLTFVVRNT